MFRHLQEPEDQSTQMRMSLVMRSVELIGSLLSEQELNNPCSLEQQLRRFRNHEVSVWQCMLYRQEWKKDQSTHMSSSLVSLQSADSVVVHYYSVQSTEHRFTD